MMNFPFGKVPPEILEAVVFRNLGAKDKDVILGPTRGEDAAILKVGDRLIATSCDPVSGAVDRAGLLAVNVSANDVATRGVKPRWLLVCILLPKNFKRASLLKICQQINDAAAKLGVAVVGGHCETSPGLDHPIIVSCCVGVAERRKYFSTAGSKPGSKIVLTKGVGIEGTGILATDRREMVARAFGAAFVKKSAKYLEETSVVAEALIASGIEGVYAMHDPTEGGVQGGLCEMADAAGCGFTVHEGKLVVSPETKALARLFRMDPLQLISSGSLLISASTAAAKKLLEVFSANRIHASVVGEMVADRNHRVLIKSDGSTRRLAMPKADALWKALKASE